MGDVAAVALAELALALAAVAAAVAVAAAAELLEGLERSSSTVCAKKHTRRVQFVPSLHICVRYLPQVIRNVRILQKLQKSTGQSITHNAVHISVEIVAYL